MGNHAIRAAMTSWPVHKQRSETDFLPAARHQERLTLRDPVAPTVFALGDVAALVATLRVGGVAPGSDTIPVRVPAVVQLQTVGVCGRPPKKSQLTVILRR